LTHKQLLFHVTSTHNSNLFLKHHYTLQTL
jgi:hypothetical protein